MLRIKRVNLQHSSYKHVFSKSILVENNVDPDQIASTEASCSGSTVLLKRIQLFKHDIRLKSYKSIVCPQNN